MGFWDSTLSSAIGSFVGVIGAFSIAKWQINKTHKLNNIPFYLKFNNAQIYINKFNREVDWILKNTEGVERKHARTCITKLDFLELKQSIELTIKTLNDDVEEVSFEKFSVELIKINKYAPLMYYKDLNFLILSMAIIYNALHSDCKYLVIDIPKKIDTGSLQSRSARFALKKFKRRYKRMKKKFDI